MAKNSISSFFDEIYNEILKNLKNTPKFNKNDLYYKIQTLSIDAKGSFGQKFLVDAMKKMVLKLIMIMIKIKTEI